MIVIRLPVADKARLHLAAVSLGVTVSDVVRYAVSAALEELGIPADGQSSEIDGQLSMVDKSPK